MTLPQNRTVTHAQYLTANTSKRSRTHCSGNYEYRHCTHSAPLQRGRQPSTCVVWASSSARQSDMPRKPNQVKISTPALKHILLRLVCPIALYAETLNTLSAVRMSLVRQACLAQQRRSRRPSCMVTAVCYARERSPADIMLTQGNKLGSCSETYLQTSPMSTWLMLESVPAVLLRLD